LNAIAELCRQLAKRRAESRKRTPLPRSRLSASDQKELEMRSRLTPYKQGDCDGLRGLYAITNALAVLCPEINKKHAKALFRTLIAACRRIERSRLPPFAMACTAICFEHCSRTPNNM
jgi:hypothetical protein